MSDFLKSLVDFLEPTGLVWLVLATLTVMHFKRCDWRLLWLSGGTWVMLTVVSVLPVPHMLLASLENDWSTVDVATMPECDAIVVLGGGMEPSVRELHGMHFMDGSDRVFTALALARQGKGKLLVIGGGDLSHHGRPHGVRGGRRAGLAGGVGAW